MDLFYNAAGLIPEFQRLSKYLDEKQKLPALVTGVSHIHKAHFIGALLRKEALRPVLTIAENEAEAQRLCTDINSMYGAGTALLYPAKELLLGDYEAASREYEHKRIFALSAMLNGECSTVICSPEAAAQRHLKSPLETISAFNIPHCLEWTGIFHSAHKPFCHFYACSFRQCPCKTLCLIVASLAHFFTVHRHRNNNIYPTA